MARKKKIINYGFAGSGRTPTDYVFGADQIKQEILQPDGQWDGFLVEKEYQNQPDEKMFCVSASAQNCNEILHKRKYGVELNMNDAYTAKSSGTTRQGNSMYAVAESLRKNDGFIRQDLWKPNNTPWNDFYADIPANIRGQALRNIDPAYAEAYLIQYHWIEPVSEENLLNALKYAPVQIAVYTDWYKDAQGIWHLRSVANPTHCITLIGYKKGVYKRCFDQYLGNEIRDLAWDFFIGYAMQYNITKIKIMTQEIFKKIGTNELYAKGADGKYHHILNEATFIKLFGAFDKVKITDLAIVDSLKGEPIALIVQ